MAVNVLEHPHTRVREGGERAGLFVVNMTESSQVAEIAERFFFWAQCQDRQFANAR